jgi:hypothetical protein
MNSCSFATRLGVLALVAWLSVAVAQPPALDYREVCGVLLSNLVGASEAELDAAAARGLIEQLAGRVTLLTNGVAHPPAEDGPSVAKAAVFGAASAYLRLRRVDEEAEAGLAEALKSLSATSRVDGLVLDLRFATGTNYAAAARLAARFLSEPVLVMSLGDQEFRAPANPQAFTQPTMALVNGRTRGAAEALAEALRQNRVALLLGSRTAGAAGFFDEFPLSTGQRLRLVTATVKLRDGAQVPPDGVVPDIPVTVSLAEERAFLEQPFAPPAAGNRPARLTEADLVRMRRERRETPAAAPADPAPPADGPVVADPVLARALDLLKGIALVKPPRRL